MGKSDEIIKQLKQHFPGLSNDLNFKLTSKATPNYNCIAWAYQKDDRWMQPPGGELWYDGVTFWPDGASKTPQIKSLIEAFATKGYEICDSEAFEQGFMKVALYWDARSGNWTHAARQHKDGTWTSKLGRSNDIQHGTPYTIEGDAYGQVYCFMKRKLND